MNDKTNEIISKRTHCNWCGKDNHVRKTSKKCDYYRTNKSIESCENTIKNTVKGISVY
jgi:hypothetical protein